jgi:hypothetical protein
LGLAKNKEKKYIRDLREKYQRSHERQILFFFFEEMNKRTLTKNSKKVKLK